MNIELRKQSTLIMIVVAVAAMTGRILSSERVYEPTIYRMESEPALAAVVAIVAATDSIDAAPLYVASLSTLQSYPEIDSPRPWPRSRPLPMPTFSSNDRSRWATVRALVEHGTFVVGQREEFPDGTYRDSGLIFEPGFESLDKVLHPQTKKFYSSKPPILTLIVAAQYWVLNRQFGLNFDNHPFLLLRLMVWMTNVLPLTVALLLLNRLVDRWGETEWAKLFVMACACFGTHLTTFSVSLNNHLPAAVTTLLTVLPWLSFNEGLSVSGTIWSGFWAGLTATLDLPAAAMIGVLSLLLIWRRRWPALAWFVLSASIPVAGLLAANYHAIGELWPAYEKFGTEWYQYPGSHWLKTGPTAKRGIDWAMLYEPRWVYAVHLIVGHHGIFSLNPIWLFTLAGCLGALAGRARIDATGVRMATGLMSLIVIVFYAAIVGQENGAGINYGGWTSGPRWFFWLIPLWLLTMIPAADQIGRTRIGRGMAIVFLALSVVSVSYPAWNPWRHPWLYHGMEALGWIPYGP